MQNAIDDKLIAFLADENLPKISEGRGKMLPDATEKMINTLNVDNPKRFFAMVEVSQIDWGGHNNDFDYIVYETFDFDKAVQKALDFARKDRNTLVIVTADHETGGLTLVGGNIYFR